VGVAATGLPPVERRVPFGEIVVMPLPAEGTCRMTAVPERGFDLGAGRGKPLEATIHGGVVGLIVDTRGRSPFALPDDARERIARLRGWNRSLGLFPREV